MIIGTVRPEEAKVFDSHGGFHRWPWSGSFEVFWHDRENMETWRLPSGWYWWACQPGCLPDGEPHGPFARSYLAFCDAWEAAE